MLQGRMSVVRLLELVAGISGVVGCSPRRCEEVMYRLKV